MLLALLSTSLSLDFSSLIDMAFQIINSLWPVFIVPIGFVFGFGMLNWIIKEIRSSIP
jgi:hypothetical protein